VAIEQTIDDLFVYCGISSINCVMYALRSIAVIRVNVNWVACSQKIDDRVFSIS